MSSGALTNAVTVTWPAASYFHTAAGGVSSGLTALTSAINAAVSPYPDNATSVTAMLGCGNFASGAGWGFNIASGNDTGLFGGVTMTAGSTPSYRNTGPGQGTDYAVGFDSAADTFSAGNTFDVGATDDLIIACVLKFSSVASSPDICSKGYWGGTGYLILQSGGTLQFFVTDGVDTASCSVAVTTGVWYACVAALDRTNNLIRIGVAPVTTGVAVVSSTASTTVIGSCSNGSNHTVGYSGNTTGDFQLAGYYVTKGSGVATGVPSALSTAVSNFANAVNSSFSVSMSTSTGLVTLSNSFWPCAMTMDDDTQSLLGFAYDFDYPQTAAQMATALGCGTWTGGAGYLCNESSGNLASVFGTPATLTASGAPTYSNLGARGGGDKALGFTGGADYFDGGASAFDVTGTDDVIIVWVGRLSGSPTASSTYLGKLAGGFASGWSIESTNTTTISFRGGAGAAVSATTSSILLNEWHVGIAFCARGANTIQIGLHGLTSGTQTTGSGTPGSTTFSTASNFRLGAAVANSQASFKLAAAYIVSGSGVASGMTLSTALTNFAAYMKSQTGTQQAKGVWLPGCPLNLDSDPAVAPKVTDRRSTKSPTGQVLSLVGNYSLRHKGVRWEAVARSQIWESAATYANGSFETFADDCLYGLGHAWFTPSSPLSIWWNDAGTDRALGYTHNSSTGVPGWYVIDVTSTEHKQVTQGWTGLWRIDFGDVVGVGS